MFNVQKCNDVYVLCEGYSILDLGYSRSVLDHTKYWRVSVKCTNSTTKPADSRHKSSKWTSTSVNRTRIWTLQWNSTHCLRLCEQTRGSFIATQWSGPLMCHHDPQGFCQTLCDGQDKHKGGERKRNMTDEATSTLLSGRAWGSRFYTTAADPSSLSSSWCSASVPTTPWVPLVRCHSKYPPLPLPHCPPLMNSSHQTLLPVPTWPNKPVTWNSVSRLNNFHGRANVSGRCWQCSIASCQAEIHLLSDTASKRFGRTVFTWRIYVQFL